MTDHVWLDASLAAGGGLLACWLGLIALMVVSRPERRVLAEAVRLLPDLLRLLRRLAGDRSLSWTIRARVALLVVYLASPLDLVPDVVPVLGYADDAILVALVLRSVVRRAGASVVRQHWPGTDDGFAALARLAGMSQPLPVKLTDGQARPGQEGSGGRESP